MSSRYVFPHVRVYMHQAPPRLLLQAAPLDGKRAFPSPPLLAEAFGDRRRESRELADLPRDPSLSIPAGLEYRAVPRRRRIRARARRECGRCVTRAVSSLRSPFI